VEDAAEGPHCSEDDSEEIGATQSIEEDNGGVESCVEMAVGSEINGANLKTFGQIKTRVTYKVRRSLLSLA
jgi:hypothetical protein